MHSRTAIQEWVKRGGRRDVELQALAIRGDGTTFEAVLRNVSYDGCLLTADAECAIGEKLRLVVPRMGEIRAEIRWSADGKAGARFVVEEIFPSEQRIRFGL